MSFSRFEDILVWQRSQELAIKSYGIFSKCRDYSFKDQIYRAVISISNNIAEGFERRTNKEFKSFLYIAKGSCGEVRSMSYLAFKLGYVTNGEFGLIRDCSEEISKMISGLIKVI
jgi:four helix bundle protein